jgi:hypothetical protein
MNASEPLMKCRKRRNGDRKRKESLAAINSEGACLLAEWSPALRWHEFYIGFYKELGNQFLGVKGAIRVGNPCKNLSTNIKNWDGVVSSSKEDSEKESERRGHIFNNWNETPREIWKD